MPARLPPYETSDRPWFGPTARAQEQLAYREHVLPPGSALRQIVDTMGCRANGIQRVRFIDFCHRGKGDFRFTIALCWTDADSHLRDALYELGPEIVQRTGWYLLPQGERLASREQASLRHRKLTDKTPELPQLGRLLSVENATNSSSCAIRLRTERGNVLLDVGFPDAVVAEPDERLVLLSHVHGDHSGGLGDAGIRQLPVIASEATACSLIGPSRLTLEEVCSRFALIAPGRDLSLGLVRVSTYPVPHCPGAAGFRVTDEQTALYFPGDVVLRTNRHDFGSELVERVASDPAERRVVLLDATMAGRRYGASGADAARALLDAAAGATDVIVLADDHSQLLYAYLDLFFVASQSADARGRVAFVVNGYVRGLAQLLHDAFIARRLDQIDPLISAQYGQRMSAWGESRWLFWLDHLRNPVGAERRVWLVHPDDLQQVPESAAGVTVGRTQPPALNGRRPLEIDTTPWTQHSSGPAVAETVRALGDDAEVLLFHAPRRKLSKFVRDEDLSHCVPLTVDGFELT